MLITGKFNFSGSSFLTLGEKPSFVMGPEANMSDKQNASVFHYVAGAHLFNVYN